MPNSRLSGATARVASSRSAQFVAGMRPRYLRPANSQPEARLLLFPRKTWYALDRTSSRRLSADNSKPKKAFKRWHCVAVSKHKAP